VLDLALFCLAIASGIAAASTACGVNMIFTVRAARDHASAGRSTFPYLAGSVLGAACTGSLLGVVALGIGPLVTGHDVLKVSTFALGVLAVVLGLRELGVIVLSVPQRNSQLNYDGLSMEGTSRRMFGFGFWLGVGFLTFSPYAGLHALAIAAVLQAEFAPALLMFVTFGLARGATVVALGLFQPSWTAVAKVADHIAASAPLAHRITAVGLFALAAGALVEVITA